MLASDSLVKYQCICCLGDVPKTSCTIRTNHSLFNCLFFLFLLFFLFSFVFLCVSVCVLSPSQSKKKTKRKKPTKKNLPIHDFVLLLQQTTFRAPFSEERSRRHWVSVWCKTACFGWNTLPPPCSGTVQPRDWSGGGVCLHFFFLPLPFSKLFFPPTLWRRSALTPL